MNLIYLLIACGFLLFLIVAAVAITNQPHEDTQPNATDISNETNATITIQYPNGAVCHGELC